MLGVYLAMLSTDAQKQRFETLCYQNKMLMYRSAYHFMQWLKTGYAPNLNTENRDLKPNYRQFRVILSEMGIRPIMI